MIQSAAANDSLRSPGGTLSTTARRFAYALVIAVFAGLMGERISTARPLMGANDRSRWCTVRALVEQGTYHIDDWHDDREWQTIDKVRMPAPPGSDVEWHFYSSKPPLLPTLVAGLHLAVRPLTGWTLADDTAFAIRTLLLLFNLVPMIGALVLVAAIAERYGRSDAGRLFVVFAAAFGTFLTPFLTTFNNHTIAAVAVIFSLYPALRIEIDGSRRPAHFALAGFFAAFAAACELPAASYTAILGAWLLYRAPKRTLAWFVPAALVPVIGFVLTNYLASGGIKPFYSYYGQDPYVYTHEGVPSYWSRPGGIDANVEPPLVYLLHCTFGHHGIFSLTPIFLLTLAAWLSAATWRIRSVRSDRADEASTAGSHPLNPVVRLSLLLTVIVLGFYLTRTANYNYGGGTVGLRWAYWLIPFWLLALVPVVDRFAYCKWFRCGAAILLAISAASAAYGFDNPWRAPWLYHPMKHWGWVDYEAANVPPPFDPPLHTWFRSLPEPAGEGEWIEFVGYDAAGGELRLRMTDAERREIDDGRALRRIEVVTTRGDAAVESHSWWIDEAAFRRGEPADRLLVWPDGEPDAATQFAAAAFLRGVPAPARYAPGRMEYPKLPIRPNVAFACRHAYASIRHQPAGAVSPLNYRGDVWLSDEFPFGVGRFVTSSSDPRSRAQMSRRHFEAIDASRIGPSAAEGTAESDRKSPRSGGS